MADRTPRFTEPTLQELQQELVREAVQAVNPQVLGASGFANAILNKSQTDALTEFLLDPPQPDPNRTRREQFEDVLRQVLKRRVEQFVTARRNKPPEIVITDRVSGLNG